MFWDFPDSEYHLTYFSFLSFPIFPIHSFFLYILFFFFPKNSSTTQSSKISPPFPFYFLFLFLFLFLFIFLSFSLSSFLSSPSPGASDRTSVPFPPAPPRRGRSAAGVSPAALGVARGPRAPCALLWRGRGPLLLLLGVAGATPIRATAGGEPAAVGGQGPAWAPVPLLKGGRAPLFLCWRGRSPLLLLSWGGRRHPVLAPPALCRRPRAARGHLGPCAWPERGASPLSLCCRGATAPLCSVEGAAPPPSSAGGRRRPAPPPGRRPEPSAPKGGALCGCRGGATAPCSLSLPFSVSLPHSLSWTSLSLLFLSPLFLTLALSLSLSTAPSLSPDSLSLSSSLSLSRFLSLSLSSLSLSCSLSLSLHHNHHNNPPLDLDRSFPRRSCRRGSIWRYCQPRSFRTRRASNHRSM